jgi:hypothetical protein
VIILSGDESDVLREMSLRLNLSNERLAMIFKNWQIEAIRYLLRIQPEGANSRSVWTNVNNGYNEPISRASIINFLNDMVDEGLLDYKDATGKGGHHRVYSIRFTEQEFKTHIIARIISKLLKEYPRATRTALQSI